MLRQLRSQQRRAFISYFILRILGTPRLLLLVSLVTALTNLLIFAAVLATGASLALSLLIAFTTSVLSSTSLIIAKSILDPGDDDIAAARSQWQESMIAVERERARQKPGAARRWKWESTVRVVVPPRPVVAPPVVPARESYSEEYYRLQLQQMKKKQDSEKATAIFLSIVFLSVIGLCATPFFGKRSGYSPPSGTRGPSGWDMDQLNKDVSRAIREDKTIAVPLDGSQPRVVPVPPEFRGNSDIPHIVGEIRDD